jgi:hypothetical protein
VQGLTSLLIERPQAVKVEVIIDIACVGMAMAVARQTQFAQVLKMIGDGILGHPQARRQFAVKAFRCSP